MRTLIALLAIAFGFLAVAVFAAGYQAVRGIRGTSAVSRLAASPGWGLRLAAALAGVLLAVGGALLR